MVRPTISTNSRKSVTKCHGRAFRNRDSDPAMTISLTQNLFGIFCSLRSTDVKDRSKYENSSERR